MTHSNEVTLIPNAGWDERILICRNGDLVQCFVVVTDRFLVMVDTMINPATALAMLRHARPFRSEGRRLLVVNTHADYDHCWGNSAFAGADAVFDAAIIGHQLCAVRFAEPQAATYLRQMQTEEPEIFGPVKLEPPNLTFSGRMTIDGGDLSLELIHTPGHTPDHVSLHIPQIRTLLAADGAEFPFPFAREAAALPQMRASLAAMARLDPVVTLYCHAKPEVGTRLLQDNIAYFDRLEAACHDALARGLPADLPASADVAALVNCSYESAVPATDAWRNVHSYYATTGHAQQLRAMLLAISAVDTA